MTMKKYLRILLSAKAKALKALSCKEFAEAKAQCISALEVGSSGYTWDENEDENVMRLVAKTAQSLGKLRDQAHVEGLRALRKKAS